MRTDRFKLTAGRAASFAALLVFLPVAMAAGDKPPQKISTPLALVTRGTPEAGDVAPGTSIYIKRDASELREDSRRTSKLVASLPKGASLQVLEQRGAMLNVRTSDGKVGWVSKLNTTDSKPRGSIADVRVLRADDLGPSERSNISSIRGLREQEFNLSAQPGDAATAAADVKRLEKIANAITPADVDQFIKDGGLEP